MLTAKDLDVTYRVKMTTFYHPLTKLCAKIEKRRYGQLNPDHSSNVICQLMRYKKSIFKSMFTDIIIIY